MINLLIANIARFIVLILLQLIVLNNIQLYGYLNPYLYVLFVLQLPFRISNTLAMVLAFLMGIIMDLFANTGGIHAAALVATTFTRPFLLSILNPAEEYEEVEEPNIWELGTGWFLAYMSIGILFHHTLLFFLEIMSFSQIGFTVGRILSSSIITLVLVLLYGFIFHKPSKQLLR